MEKPNRSDEMKILFHIYNNAAKVTIFLNYALFICVIHNGICFTLVHKHNFSLCSKYSLNVKIWFLCIPLKDIDPVSWKILRQTIAAGSIIFDLLFCAFLPLQYMIHVIF